MITGRRIHPAVAAAQDIDALIGRLNRLGDSIEVEVQKVDEALGKISLSPINPENGERYDGPERKPREGGDRDRDRDRGRGGRDRDHRPRRDRGDGGGGG